MRSLRRGATEANPLARTVFARLGVVGGALALKAIGLPLILYVTWRYPNYWWAPSLYAFLLLAVVGSNIFNSADS